MILVLEDMQVRVDWLRDLVGDRVKVVWSTTVEQLVIDRRNVRPSLVILDHDLGGPPCAGGPPSRDANGHDGLYACERIRAVECPVLVWSMNPTRAPLMVESLRRRGMRALWAPFGTHECTAAIVRAVTA